MPCPSSRRDFLRSAAVLGAGLWLAPRLSLPRTRFDRAQRPEGPVEMIRRAALTDPMPVQRLRGKLSSVSGSGGHIVVLADPDGVLLSDSGIVGPRVAQAVASISAVPIRHLINTHWHFDHTDANAWLAEHGATILAQQNTRAHLSRDTRVEDWNFTFSTSPAAALPREVFDRTRIVEIGKSRIRLEHYAPAHTDADISVHFEHEDVLHVADTWWNGIYPFIDYSTGGSIDGMIAATKANIARASARTIIVPGHGPVGNRAQLAGFLEMLVTVRDRVATLKQEGRTIQDVFLAKPTAAFDARWDGTIINPDFFTRLVYKGV
jgi:glyoxylase-like metal-dependent hydrolase (beta-lactamase superfamily II)